MFPTDSGYARATTRKLGLMVTAGFRNVETAWDLAVARRVGATCVEILPYWRDCPDAGPVGRQVMDAGLVVHSVHGGWGGQSLACERIDLGSGDENVRRASVADIEKCIAWASGAGAGRLIVHPGGLSLPEDMERRMDALRRSLEELADLAPSEGFVCVENMPKGVCPGSDMGDLSEILDQVGRRELALVVDTGHAEIVENAASQTRKAGDWLASTHVHDNDGKKDIHAIPGTGVVDWPGWVRALDEIGYWGPVMLECIRDLRVLEMGELGHLGEEFQRILRTG